MNRRLAAENRAVIKGMVPVVARIDVVANGRLDAALEFIKKLQQIHPEAAEAVQAAIQADAVTKALQIKGPGSLEVDSHVLKAAQDVGKQP